MEQLIGYGFLGAAGITVVAVNYLVEKMAKIKDSQKHQVPIQYIDSEPITVPVKVVVR